MYHDGHERTDVVEYGREFLTQMDAHEERVPSYHGADMNVIARPKNPGAKQLIMVVYDESSFQSHDGKHHIWADGHHRPIHAKSPEKSLMVSAFSCDCHSLLRFDADQQAQHPEFPAYSTETIKSGRNHDGY